MNGNSFRLGVSGSGKSFSAKEEIVHLALSTDDDILILDSESEFTKLVEALGGQVVKVSATSDNHLNAMDMDASYGNEKNPLIENRSLSCLYLNSWLEQEICRQKKSRFWTAVLQMCTGIIYEVVIQGKFRR